jgi:hypothetical protein
MKKGIQPQFGTVFPFLFLIPNFSFPSILNIRYSTFNILYFLFNFSVPYS